MTKKRAASFTASMIAVARGLGDFLPEDARLAHDAFGFRFATTRALAFIARHGGLFAALLDRVVLAVQLRTRTIDDLLLAFYRDGGRQIVLLGAGFDCRAARFGAQLVGARIFEVDHPVTQATKRARIDDPSCVSYLPWDFDERSATEIPQALAGLGHHMAEPTMIIWEGVTMYLTEPAVDASVRAVSALSAPGSTLVFTYVTPVALARTGLLQRLVRRLVAGRGEPLRFGFVPEELRAWLAERGLALALDTSFSPLAKNLLPQRYHPWFDDETNRIAIARVI